MLTTNQNQLIELLKAEFSKINEKTETKGTFNLVDINPLKEFTIKSRAFKEEQKALSKACNQVAENEVYRIITLLKEDLPTAFIEKMGKSNGHIEYNTILIGSSKEAISGHYEHRISIDVRARYTDKYNHEFKQNERTYHGLIYVYNSLWSASIENLFKESPSLKEDLRQKLKL